MKGILLDNDNDLLIVNGGMVVGDTEIQDAAIIIAMNQGEQKFEPVLGPNLVQLINAKASSFDIEQRVRVHLGKAGLNYAAIKEKIKIDKR